MEDLGRLAASRACTFDACKVGGATVSTGGSVDAEASVTVTSAATRRRGVRRVRRRRAAVSRGARHISPHPALDVSSRACARPMRGSDLFMRRALAPYRFPSPDPDAALASLVDVDGLARAIEAHRRRAIIGLACGVITLFAGFRVALAAEDLTVLHRFAHAGAEPVVPARSAMRVQAPVLASTAPAIPERDAALFFPDQRLAE